MSHRGTAARKTREWARAQYRLGKKHGLFGQPGIWADRFYQRGYRVGQAKAQRDPVSSTEGE